MMRLLNPLSHECQPIREGGRRFDIPGSLSNGEFLPFGGLMCQQGHQRKQTQQGRWGARNGGIRPLALGFDPQVSADFVKGDFHAPAADKPAQNLARIQVQDRRQDSLGLKDPLWIADQHLTNGQWGQTLMKPEGGIRDDLHRC